MGYFDFLKTQPESTDQIITNSGHRYEAIDIINLNNITQIYKGNGVENKLFDDFNFAVKDISGEGQFISLLGKSGCGKSTILRYIAGLQTPTSGNIKIYDKIKTEKDHIPMIFQQYSSFNWMSVIENIALPLIIKGVNKTEALDKAEKLIGIVGLKGHEQKWAKYPLLSGGQLQRVAIARSLIANPQILLLDEPFSALDIQNRAELQNILLDIFYNSDVDVTFILVTHDIREAVYLSNKIFLMQSNPASIFKEYDVIFNQKREKSIKYTNEYNSYVRQIENDFELLSEKK